LTKWKKALSLALVLYLLALITLLTKLLKVLNTVLLYASARCRDMTIQTASEDISVRARLRRIATFLITGALQAYLLT